MGGALVLMEMLSEISELADEGMRGGKRAMGRRLGHGVVFRRAIA